jgi:hypothetical protein
MLKLSIECTRFVSNYSSCTGRSSENICSGSRGAQLKDRKKVSLPPKLVEKLSFRFVKFSFPVACLMPYYVETGQAILTP